MTGYTSDLHMLALQGISGVTVMIKTDGFPVLLTVTGFTFCPEISLVLVICPVTADTGATQFFF